MREKFRCSRNTTEEFGVQGTQPNLRSI